MLKLYYYTTFPKGKNSLSFSQDKIGLGVGDEHDLRLYGISLYSSL
jgi:hypothetical protein